MESLRTGLEAETTAGRCREEWKMKKRTQETGNTKNQIPLILLPAVLGLALTIVVVAAFRRGQAQAGSEASSAPAGEAAQEKWQEGTVSYHGKHYRYNNSLRTYLLMGIDKEGPAAEAHDGVSGGQSDAMFLFVADSDNESVSVISINRNTMTKIETLDESGTKKGEVVAQICVQHGYGDGRHYSCGRTVDAVSNLFYHLPISGYLSLYMDAVPILNDAVGGVTVTVLQDVEDPSRGVSLHEGDVKNLNGMEAYCYLRKRDINEFDSATARLRRQEQYISEYMKKLKTAVAGSASKAAEIYDSVSDYLVTDVDFANLLSELVTYEFDGGQMYMVPGETRMGEVYEEFYVDDDALYDLIIQVFYKEAGS